MKQKSLEKISRIVSAASELADILSDEINDNESSLGNAIADLLRTEAMEFTISLSLMGELIEKAQGSKSIPVYESESTGLKVN